MLRKLFGNCVCDVNQQQQHEQQFFKRTVTTEIRKCDTETTFASSISSDADIIVGATGFKQPDKFIKRQTPVLFSTDRGLHLRVAKLQGNSQTGSPSNIDQPIELYDISFCDLERWSTNRAHTVSLEDTFMIARRKLEPVEEHPTSTSKLYPIHRNSGPLECYNSSSLFPAERPIHLNNATYSRYENCSES